MNREELKRLRRWRRTGLPPFRPAPVSPVPAQRASDEAMEHMERLMDTQELAAIYPNAGEDWRAER